MKPILFSTPMVSAILDGRKSQTRRVMKPKYSNTHFEFRTDKYGTQFVEMQNDIEGETWGKNPDGSTWHKLLGYIPIKPRYQPGDILWVRETFNDDETADVLYAADQDFVDYGCKDIDDRTIFEGDVKWRPSIFMPYAAARIFLRVTDVRCERVQDITNNDAIKEGCAGAACDCLHTGRSWMGCESCINTGWQEPPVVEFMQLWDGLNAKPKPQYGYVDGKKRVVSYISYPWDDVQETRTYRGKPWHVCGNPWVFVYSFTRITKEEADAQSTTHA